MKDVLFSPIQIGTLKIPNRFVRSATNDYMADNDGCITSRQIELYRQLAEGGIGLIISGFLYVHPTGKASPGQTGIYSDDHIPGLRSIADTVHKAGSIIAAQIVHGGRQARPRICGGEAIAPSAVEDTKTKVQPREMSRGEVESVIQWFVDASVRAQKAGFDAVQLHAAHGYLLSQFISPHTNRRDDDWGGTAEKRSRIIFDILRKIRETAGQDFPVFIKLNVKDFLPGGLDIHESLPLAVSLDKAGIDAIEISGGMVEAEGTPMAQTGILSPDREAYFRMFAEQIKPVIRCPLILVGGIRSVKVMEQLIQEGTADMVSMCRPFIREPDLVSQLQKGKEKGDCISCNKCFNPRGIRCPHVEK